MKTLFLTIIVLLLATSFPLKSSNRLLMISAKTESEGNSDRLIQKAMSSVTWKDIPVLCYHNISYHTKAGDYTIAAGIFKEHMQLLADSGYHSILPDQLYNYLANNDPLPARPVMITFDDSHAEHYAIAAPVMEQYGIRGVFFIMNVTIGKPGYLSAAQIKTLSDRGHVIGLHTWDHQLVRNLDEKGWEMQVTKPKSYLENITGKPVVYFAYPSGVWNESSVIELKRREIKAAFQLYGKHSVNDKLYTIRRIIVPGSWSATRMQKELKSSFQ